MSVHVGIVGFRGYSGAEAVHLLASHPYCEPVLLEHRADSGEDAKLLRKSSVRRAPATPESVASEGLKAVLLATPPDVSMDLAPKFLNAGAVVIDLSGAFRLRTPERYKQWYKEEHTAPALLADAAYGLPEYNRDCIRQAKLVSNPGCYPTAANLAIRPLVAAGIVDRMPVSYATRKAASAERAASRRSRRAFAKPPRTFPLTRSSRTGTCRKSC